MSGGTQGLWLGNKSERIAILWLNHNMAVSFCDHCGLTGVGDQGCPYQSRQANVSLT